MGGQSLAALDFALAPYVKKTFIKELIKIVELDITSSDSLEDIKLELEAIGDNTSLLDKKEEIIEVLDSYNYDWEDSDYLEYDAYTDKINKLTKYYEKALERTDRETFQAMEGLVHNLNTLASRAANQVPFSSINFGMDTSEEGRMVSKNLMLAQEKGLGLSETPIFPILIFTLKGGYNLNPEDPNYDLFKLSCRVSAKRLFPKHNWGLLVA